MPVPDARTRNKISLNPTFVLSTSYVSVLGTKIDTRTNLSGYDSIAWQNSEQTYTECSVVKCTRCIFDVCRKGMAVGPRRGRVLGCDACAGVRRLGCFGLGRAHGADVQAQDYRGAWLRCQLRRDLTVLCSGRCWAWRRF